MEEGWISEATPERGERRPPPSPMMSFDNDNDGDGDVDVDGIGVGIDDVEDDEVKSLPSLPESPPDMVVIDEGRQQQRQRVQHTITSSNISSRQQQRQRQRQRHITRGNDIDHANFNDGYEDDHDTLFSDSSMERRVEFSLGATVPTVFRDRPLLSSLATPPQPPSDPSGSDHPRSRPTSAATATTNRSSRNQRLPPSSSRTPSSQGTTRPPPSSNTTSRYLQHLATTTTTTPPQQQQQQQPLGTSHVDTKSPYREVRLERRLEALKKELRDAQSKLEVETSQRKQLQKTVETLSHSNTQILGERDTMEKSFQEQLLESNSKVTSLEKKLKVSEVHYSQEVNTLQQELQRSKDQLTKTNDKYNQLETKSERLEKDFKELRSTSSASRSDQEKKVYQLLHTNQTLQSQINSKQEENNQLKKDLEKNKDKAKSLQIELNQIRVQNNDLQRAADETSRALENKCNECLRMTEEEERLRKQLEEANKRTPRSHSIGIQTSFQKTSLEPNFDVPSISLRNKLAQIQLESERATLNREHQIQMERVVNDHNRELEEQEQRFSMQIAKMEADADDERSTSIKEAKRAVTHEYEQKIQDMERNHRKEIAKIREDGDRRIRETNESLEIALAQASAATEECENETRKRKSVEHLLQQTNHEHQVEKQDLLHHHDQEVAQLHTLYDEERVGMLQTLQQQCTQLIEASRASVGRKGTRKTMAAPATPINRPKRPPPIETQPTSNRSKSPQRENSPSNLSIAESLKETEDYVMKILGGKL